MRRLLVVLFSALMLFSSARTTPTIEPTSVRALVIEGHGWGHGLGMSQWGARGMAEVGFGSAAILHRYYAHVRIARTSASVRVRVLLDRTHGLLVTSSRPYRVLFGGRVVRAAGKAWFRASIARVRTKLERAPSSGGPWRYVASTVGSVSFAQTRGPFRVVTASRGRLYRGAVVVRRSGVLLAIVNDLPIEEYLLGVVPREMPASWSRAALQAQAVAARTYALRAREAARRDRDSWDICATAACQVYGGAGRWTASGQFIQLEDARADEAIRSTRGEVLTYKNHLITASYASSSGGMTQQGTAPYLRAVPDPYDIASPHHSWKVVIPVARVERAWPMIGRFRGVRVIARDGRGAWGGRVARLVLIGTARSIKLSGSAFQSALGLRSRWFIVRPEVSRVSSLFSEDFGFGSRSSAVIELQRRLLAEGFFPRTVQPTGTFGTVTRAAVQRYQRAQGIPPTGFVGPRTRRALNRRR